MMVSLNCQPWPAEEATSKLSDAGAPLTHRCLPDVLGAWGVLRPCCGMLSSGGVFDLL